MNASCASCTCAVACLLLGSYVAYKRPESVLVVVRTLSHRVLVIKRAGAGDEGFWQSVTGSLEPGETAAACAARELREETGIVAAVRDCQVLVRFRIRASALHRYAPGALYNEEHLFDCVLDEAVDVMLSEEHTAFEWLSVEAAIERVWSETNRDGIRRLCV